MALKTNLIDKENDKFVETSGGDTAVRVVAEDFTINNANISVDLDHTEDSVALGDGTNTVGVTTSNQLKVFDSKGMVNFEYDFLSLTENATDDVWTFKTGGSGGTTVGTIIIQYTDGTKATIQDVTKT